MSLQFLKPILVSLWRFEQFAYHYIIFTHTYSAVTQFKHVWWLNVNAHVPSSTLYTLTNQIYSGAKCLQCKLVKSLVFYKLVHFPECKRQLKATEGKPLVTWGFGNKIWYELRNSNSRRCKIQHLWYFQRHLHMNSYNNLGCHWMIDYKLFSRKVLSFNKSSRERMSRCDAFCGHEAGVWKAFSLN